jgi:hypothetical protein
MSRRRNGNGRRPLKGGDVEQAPFLKGVAAPQSAVSGDKGAAVFF